jgi:hypothetical protein
MEILFFEDCRNILNNDMARRAGCGGSLQAE